MAIEIVDLPTNDMVIFHSYSLPEGIQKKIRHVSPGVQLLHERTGTRPGMEWHREILKNSGEPKESIHGQWVKGPQYSSISISLR
jgi:hypothetical protein